MIKVSMTIFAPRMFCLCVLDGIDQGYTHTVHRALRVSERVHIMAETATFTTDRAGQTRAETR